MKPIVVPMNIAELEKTIPVNVSENQREIPFLSDTDVRPMPEISIGDVETLPTGSEAEAWMTGDSYYPVLNLAIPEGPQGEPGESYVLTEEDRTEIAGIVENDMTGTYVPVNSGLLNSSVVSNNNGDVTITTKKRRGFGYEGVSVKADIGFTVTRGAYSGNQLVEAGSFGLNNSGEFEVKGCPIRLTDGSGTGNDIVMYSSVTPYIDGISTPTGPKYAANKQYVDDGLALKQDALSVKLEISGTEIPVTGFKEITESGIHGMRLLAGTGAEWFFADADGLNTVYNSLSNAISGKQNALTFDNTPTEDSTNPVTSGGIYTALASKQDSGNYAASASGDITHTALKAAGIMYGEVDSTSTSTAYTATIPGITSYYDGLTVMLRNGVVTSAENFTIDINGLGAVGSYSNMATGNDITPTAPTRDSTIFNINYTMLFVYSSTVVSGGCWICYRGYNSDTNTISYQIRTNSTTLPTVSRTRYYRILFTSADSTQWVPANTQYDNSATSTKTVNQTPINPHGRIVYMSGTTNVAAGSNVSATVVWDQYALALGYSFNRTGSALTLTTKKPVYVKCAPQADGSAIMDSTEPIVQDLPTTADGKIYIYLGIAYSATNIELTLNNPVYHYYNGAIRLWTGPV